MAVGNIDFMAFAVIVIDCGMVVVCLIFLLVVRPLVLAAFWYDVCNLCQVR
jgi:hypothetical protein